ncbi:NACHT, LRR and PYD domains-containing protein 5-like, partial [Heptranchias perlo]|uniref:NACHT, LRR and PYD domains-containing protein 5-like n=1 Tax=Heptranchias perlo TaxID=212740 RepID=UPI00355A46CA
LVSNDLSLRCFDELALALTTNQRLVKLYLNHNQLKDLDVIKLCSALKEPQCRLQVLHLSHNQITSNSCQAMVSVLTQSQALSWLNLTHNKIGNSGVKILCRALKDQDCKLQKLSLKHNNLTYDSCEELASALKENCGLLDLDISANKITDLGVGFLCQVLKNSNSKIQCLRFSLNNLSAKCCQDLAAILVELRTINGLHLNFNTLGDSGVKYLCAALKDRDAGMEELSLKSNYLTDECCGDLVSALCVKSTLKYLDLSFNGLTDKSLDHFHRLVLSCASLEEITLQANCFSSEGCKALEELRKTRPKLQVFF